LDKRRKKDALMFFHLGLFRGDQEGAQGVAGG
jgi:hypothetical protein